MVRLLGKIAEKQILATHDTILKHGKKYSAAAKEQGSTLGINTGFNSVKRGWVMYAMKTAPFTALSMMGPEGVPTAGATMWVARLVTLSGAFTIDWYAIGD